MTSRILIVDDNADAAETLRVLLKAMGADVEVANDGFTALKLFASHKPAAVLLDIAMPAMDGYEVARRMRAQFPEHKAMIIAVSAWAEERERRFSQAAGFDMHWGKPADVGNLKSLLSLLDSQQKPPRTLQ